MRWLCFYTLRLLLLNVFCYIFKKISFLLRFDHYWFCMPSFNSRKCPSSHHRSLNHSVVKKLPVPSAQGRLADQAGISCSSSPFPPLPFATASPDKQLGCTSTTGRIAFSHPGNPEGGKEKEVGGEMCFPRSICWRNRSTDGGEGGRSSGP